MFPAHAGMIRLPTDYLMAWLCVPRPRGDDPLDKQEQALKEKCSPPTRG